MRTSRTSSDVVLVNPLVEREGAGDHVLKSRFHTPPEGLCYLAACLRQAGFTVSIIDAAALSLPGHEVVQRVLSVRPLVAGFSATTVSVSSAAAIARALKDQSAETVTVLGGPHVTLLPRDTLTRYPFFDYGVVGEGEVTLVELVRAVTDKGADPAGVAGLVFASDGGIVLSEPRKFIDDLDSLPLPAWDLLPELRTTYRQSVARSHAGHSVGILTSRGCSGRCNFCARAVFGNRLRAFSADRVLDLFGVLERDFHVEGAVINDDNFVVFKKRLYEVCRRLSGRSRKFLWSCFARVDQVDEEVCKLLYAGGCRSVSFGLESGNQEMLDSMNKGTTLDQAERAVRAAYRAGLYTTGYFILGYPGETALTIDDTIAFAGKLPLDNVLYSFATPYPGTEFYDSVGGEEIDWDRFSQWQTTYVPEGLSEDDLRRYLSRATLRFYRRPRVWFRHAERAMRERLVGPYLREGLNLVRFSFRSTGHS